MRRSVAGKECSLSFGQVGPDLNRVVVVPANVMAGASAFHTGRSFQYAGQAIMQRYQSPMRSRFLFFPPHPFFELHRHPA